MSSTSCSGTSTVPISSTSYGSASRKYNGLITGMTQNVDELLRSDTARLMLANSEFLIMLNQSATDREELAKLLNISDTQLGYITNVPAGCGLIRCAGIWFPSTTTSPGIRSSTAS